MTSPIPLKSALLLGAAVLALSACDRDAEKAAAPAAPAPAPAVVTPAAEPVPFVFNSENTYAKVGLSLPQAVKPWPDLHARLYAASVRDLRQFTEGAQADRTEAGGDQGMAPYEKRITFDTPVETGKIFSLARRDYDFTGGAHGNMLFAGVLWDKALKRPIPAADLFRPGADLTVLDRALCAAINSVKRERDPEATTLTLAGGDWSCPKAAATPFVLTAGTTSGKAGGLTFLLAPYLVGPYSDGTYTVQVPQSAFRALLAPAYADEFAGQPIPPAAPGGYPAR